MLNKCVNLTNFHIITKRKNKKKIVQTVQCMLNCIKEKITTIFVWVNKKHDVLNKNLVFSEKYDLKLVILKCQINPKWEIMGNVNSSNRL